MAVDRMSSHALDLAVGLFASADRGVRWHVRLRRLLSRLEDVEALVPRSGVVLDVGCGHGLVTHYLALASPDRRVVGIDLDAAKIDAARAVVHDDHVRFEQGDARRPPRGPFDAAVIVDVFYLLPRAVQAEALVAVREVLAPGGVLVWKAQERRPWWKYAITYAQEWLATRSGVTMGAALDFLPREDAVGMLEAAGYRMVEIVEMRRRVYSDVIYVAKQ
jgi:SAM-dependent methyltransferase